MNYLLASICILLLLVILFFVGLLFFRSYTTQHSTSQEIFLSGTIPGELPSGQLSGSVTFETNWKGKKFDQGSQTGINTFEENGTLVEKYPFKTYVAKGLKDPNIDVIKIEYDIPQNPFWLRWVLDEIVEVKPGEFLGKVHLRLGFFSFALGYFKLSQ